jgi:EAL domain-containing protein (putative c-di-GMP-specific phosphodiesterase class I)
MGKSRRKDDDHISVSIYKGFYVNENLGLSTILKDYEKIEEIFNVLQYMACITIQVPQLKKIEYKYGSIAYNNMLQNITNLIKAIKDEKFRNNDILVADIFESETFIIFLAAPRKDRTQLLDHMEHLAERLRINIKTRLFELLFPLLKENIVPAIGYGLVVKNPMIKNIRHITHLVSDSKMMGMFLTQKQKYHSKYLLQKLIINQSIRTVFQPIVYLKTLEILGYEALSRGPDGSEFESPLFLFLIAEESGLSFELDRLCRKKSFEAVRKLNIRQKIFVNTLTMTIHDPDFRGIYLKDLLADLKVKPENVVFEISEKLAIDNYDIFKQALQDYTDIGIVHADDDMGTGYSDLERIMELKPGYLKVDISLVRDIDKTFIKQELMKAMISLAASINSEIIAEGIETREELETLRKLGVKFGQGFLLAKPAPTLTEVHLDE